MDRLLSLKKSDADSTLNNSTISELGYETAHDSNNSSIYFSVLETSDDETLNASDHLQAMATTSNVEGEIVSVIDLQSSSPSRPFGSTSSTETIEVTVISRFDSNSVPTPTEPVERNSSANPEPEPEVFSIESNENSGTMISQPAVAASTVQTPVLNSNSEVPLEINVPQPNEILPNSDLIPEPEVSPIESNVNTAISTSQLSISVPRPTVHFSRSENVVQTTLGSSSNVSAVENWLPSNVIFGNDSNIPLGHHETATLDPNLPAVTIRNETLASSSTVVQGLYVNVVAINTQQQINQITAPEQSTRPPIGNRAMRLQNQDPYRTRATRYTMVNFRTNEMPRRHTNMSRRTLRNIQNEAVPTASRPSAFEAGPSSSGQPKISAPKESHICDVCNKSFPLRSTLIVHKSCHQTKSSNANICKYCDRSFQKSIALDNHLKEKCEKIPTAARRKLLTEEFNARK